MVNYEFLMILVISKHITAALESLMYDGINDLNLSYPAVSHSCSLTILWSNCIHL